MSYITTVSGRHFDPAKPDKALIDIFDIAHSLSLLCRANGHFRSFYSVAQHSIACALEAEARGETREVILGCLLHDASEAYLSDVTRPVKALLPRYIEIESKLQDAVWEKFIGRPLTDEEKHRVFEIDDLMLSYEFHMLMPEELGSEYRLLKTAPDCAPRDLGAVESEFISLFRKFA